MSSMRNAVQRRNHKERAQPLEREKKWGVLEKHKDYSLRARDFNAKKTRLRALRAKASTRNPDEFSFGMVHSQSRGGIKIADRGNTALPMDTVKLLKTQDQGYIRTMLQQARKERERLEQGIVLGEDGARRVGEGDDGEGDEEEEFGFAEEKSGKGRHMVFVDGKDAQKAFQPADFFAVSSPSDLSRTWNRPRRPSQTSPADPPPPPSRKSSKRKMPTAEQAEEAAAAQQTAQERAQRKARYQLEAVRKKEGDLLRAEQELDKQRARTAGLVGGTNKNGVRFRVRGRRG